MVRDGSSPGGRQPASTLITVIPPVAMAVCAAFTASVVSGEAFAPTVWCGVVATAAVALLAFESARRRRALAALRAWHAEQDALARARLARQEAEMKRLAIDVLPKAVGRLQEGETPEQVMRGISCQADVTPEFQTAHRQILRSVLETVQAEEDLRETAQRAFVNIARRVQAIVHQQATDLRQMEDRHGENEDVFHDLLHIDHGTALIGRLADSIAVISGARPGRQWQREVPLFRVLRGAMSRILEYQRVDLHSVAEVAIEGPTVEPLIHALAELLDNATRYSPPQTRVHLTAIEVQSGVAVEIEDGGVGLSEDARVRAERVLALGQSGLDLNDLGETPRLGLTVVSQLARMNNFQISLRPSAYGGVRAVLVVPKDVIAPLPANSLIPGIRTPMPGPMPMMAGPVDEEPMVVQRNANGLPQRVRRSNGAPRPRPGGVARPKPAARPVRASAPRQKAEPKRAESSTQPGMWLAAFTEGVSGDSPSSGPHHRSDDESSDRGE